MNSSVWRTIADALPDIETELATAPSPPQPAIDSPSSQASGMHEIARLEARFERLLLVARSMWILLQEKTGLTDEQLEKLAAHLDAQDGTLDGRRKRPQAQCPKCDSVISAKYNRCLFCGEPGAVESAFDAV